MKEFNYYLDKTGEIGFVEQSLHSLVYATGIPHAKPHEVVLFETGDVGEVLSLTEKHAEILLLSKAKIDVGTKLVRTAEQLRVAVSKDLLGKTLNPMGKPIKGAFPKEDKAQLRPLDKSPPTINARKVINQPFETGVTIVDLIVPLGRGQRELVIGNRKTGKTGFLLQAIYSAASRGLICVYAAIAKKRLDIKMIEEYLSQRRIDKNTIVVASSSADPVGLIYLTPYTAMTIAEYFRDLGADVLIVLDDLTAHAKYYREISLLARHFPGRSSYPGDIFFIHSRLLERAGNFLVGDGKTAKKEASSITCLPVAELVMGDLSGYIQTNLMAMTDGHIFFDIDLYNQGRRPPVNPFLSVTRVGRQTQTLLLRDLSRTLTSFLVHLEDLRQFMHFGAELSEETKRTLALGDRITAFFDQSSERIIPLNANVIIATLLWAGFWNKYPQAELEMELDQIISKYQTDASYKKLVDSLISGKERLSDLVGFIKRDESVALGLGKKYVQK